MYSTTTIDFKILAAERLKESISFTNSNTTIYFTYGKVDGWTNEPVPDVANNSISAEYELWEYMVGGKRIVEGDVRHVVPKYEWTSNTSYTAYDNLSPNLFNEGVKFYVVNSSGNVYKCLSNNNGKVSVNQPTSTATNNTIQTADGYVWKFMYGLTESEKQRFTTSRYMPVQTLTTDNGSLQWDVQTGTANGAIHSIVIKDAGVGYTNASNLVVTITGDGADATATATINTYTNSVNAIYMTSIGTGYTKANVTITGGGGFYANARAIIAPAGGHGKDPLYELGGKYLMFNPKLQNIEGGILPAVNNFRQVGMILNPLLRQSSNISSNSAFSQTTDLTLSGSSADYIDDEWVYQGASFESAYFKGKVVSWNNTTGLIRLSQTDGSPSTQSLIGANSISSRFVTSIVYPELEQNSGKILYINNITPITRNIGQTEDFKIIIKF
jgi:hypothetical protein